MLNARPDPVRCDIEGGDGNDILDGGTGNNYLEGGEGDDTYLIGSDRGTTFLSADAGSDMVVLDGIDAAGADLWRLGGHLRISSADGSSTVMLMNYFGSEGNLSQITFSDGEVWDGAYLAEQSAALPDYGAGSNGAGQASGAVLFGGANSAVLKGESYPSFGGSFWRVAA